MIQQSLPSQTSLFIPAGPAITAVTIIAIGSGQVQVQTKVSG